MNLPLLSRLTSLALPLLAMLPLLAHADDAAAGCTGQPDLAETMASDGTHQEFLQYLNDIIRAEEFSTTPAVLDPNLLAQPKTTLHRCPQVAINPGVEERILIEALHNVATTFAISRDSSPEIFYQQYGLEKMLLAEIYLLKSQQKSLTIDWHDGGKLRTAFAEQYPTSTNQVRDNSQTAQQDNGMSKEVAKY